MTYIRQFAVIITVCFIGEVLQKYIPLPVPASIWGLLLMFVSLKTKIFPLKAVDTTSDFILAIMPLLFVPSTVALITAGPTLKKYGIQFLIIGVVSTIVVFGVTGIVTQAIIRLTHKNSSGNVGPSQGAGPSRGTDPARGADSAQDTDPAGKSVPEEAE
ncbi:MAG TPA: murein hydrolase regulator LrgA [Treponema sp.]|nr:murein hydrolase regulator LrgA [Treponema sp.]